MVSVKPVRILAERLCLFKHGNGGASHKCASAAPSSECSLGKSDARNRSVIILSTYLQSLVRSIKGSTKLGPVKIGGGHSLRCWLSDLWNHTFSGCVTLLQCFLGHHGPSWTTVYMPALPFMQAALDKPSNPNFTLGREIFIKYYVSLNRILLIILTGTVGRSLHHFKPWSWSYCS